MVLIFIRRASWRLFTPDWIRAVASLCFVFVALVVTGCGVRLGSTRPEGSGSRGAAVVTADESLGSM